MYSFLEKSWKDLTSELPIVKNEYYKQLIQLYKTKDRFYHNLSHIETLLKFSEHYKHLLNSPKAVDFSIWYHDAIYSASRSNNEEKSAELAKKHLSKLDFDANFVKHCYDMIMSTKNHQVIRNLNSFDTQFLLDIDLSILAVERFKYIEYTKQIRKEYAVFPDFLYKKGRKNVLKHFLEMKTIYKTELFQKCWEEKAKENLDYEFSLL